MFVFRSGLRILKLCCFLSTFWLRRASKGIFIKFSYKLRVCIAAIKTTNYYDTITSRNPTSSSTPRRAPLELENRNSFSEPNIFGASSTGAVRRSASVVESGCRCDLYHHVKELYALSDVCNNAMVTKISRTELYQSKIKQMIRLINESTWNSLRYHPAQIKTQRGTFK